MLLKTKKKLTYISIAISYLLCGVQYAIIFPSLNLFITERYHSSAMLLGVIIAAYSISGLFSGPLFGYIVDKMKNSRTVILAANVANIIGNIMYMMGISPPYLIVSRLVCGIGSGSASAMFADITRSSSESERTSLIAIMLFFQEIGLLFAPGFAFVFRNVHFYIGPFLIDKFTAPGLIMAALYSILEIIFIFMYYNLSYLHDIQIIEESLSYDDNGEHAFFNDPVLVKGYGAVNDYQSEVNDSLNNLLQGDSESLIAEENTNIQEKVASSFTVEIVNPPCTKKTQQKYDEPKPGHVSHLTADHSYNELCTNSYSSGMIESAERYILSLSDDESMSSRTSHSRQMATSTDNLLTASDNSLNDEMFTEHCNVRNYVSHVPSSVATISYKEEYLRDEIIVLLGLQFISAFSQTTLETILTPLSKKYYNWSDLENSCFYLAAGLVVMLTFLILRPISRCISDRFLLLGGVLMMILSYVWLLAFFVRYAIPGSLSSLPFFAIGAFFDLVGLPITMVCSPSLFSKLTSRETQGFSQGIRRTFLFSGLILGPLWGGSAFHYTYALFAVPLAVLVIITIMLLMSFKKLQVPDTIRLRNRNQSGTSVNN